jgi:hypothetical protein
LSEIKKEKMSYQLLRLSTNGVHVYLQNSKICVENIDFKVTFPLATVRFALCHPDRSIVIYNPEQRIHISVRDDEDPADLLNYFLYLKQGVSSVDSL